MNIFYLDLNPTKAAGWLVDKHVIKMILEYTQLLANAFHMDLAKVPPPETKAGTKYQKAHWDHPSAVWVRDNFKHWHWVKMSAFELCNEYERRFPGALIKRHACYDAIAYMEKNSPISWMKHASWVDPPQCMPAEFQVRNDAVAAYRAYYKVGKKHLHQWTNATPPEWIIPRRKTVAELAQDLIDAAELQIIEPDKHRPDNVEDNEWEQAKLLATNIINGRA